jgi:hypothetical protein
MVKILGQVMVREYFSERGPYKVVHISSKGNVSFEKEDGEVYFRNEKDGLRFINRRG